MYSTLEQMYESLVIITLGAAKVQKYLRMRASTPNPLLFIYCSHKHCSHDADKGLGQN